MSAVLLIVAAGVVVATLAALRRAGARRRRAAEEQERVLQLLRALATELEAGSTPEDALAAVGTELDEDAGVADGLGDTLRAASAPGTGGAALGTVPALYPLAAAWSVSAATGAPLAALLRRQAEVVGQRRTADREVRAALAGPRTTARLLAGLPALGLLLAAASGSGAVGFLVGTTAGRACLLGGVLLDAAGLWWVERWAVGRPEPPRAASRDPAAQALIVDLLAAALEAGAPLSTALQTADAAVPGRVRTLDPLRRLVDEGTEHLVRPDDDVGGEVPPALVRLVRRSSRSGARLAGQLRTLADDLRDATATEDLERARRVGVLAVLPLGLCCLPAFVLLTVVPMAAGLLTELSL